MKEQNKESLAENKRAIDEEIKLPCYKCQLHTTFKV